VLPAEFESDVIKFTHESLGHQGTAKYIAQIANTFHVNNLGRKIRKLVSRCGICQRMKHPNRSYMTEWHSHLPTERGTLCATDLFGPLPVGRGGVRYILVILDIFSKSVKLYALRAATTKACLNKIANHYLTHVTQPKRLLSDNGSQFASPLWRRKLEFKPCTLSYVGLKVIHLRDVCDRLVSFAKFTAHRITRNGHC
jgi:hypothetical protein